MSWGVLAIDDYVFYSLDEREREWPAYLIALKDNRSMHCIPGETWIV